MIGSSNTITARHWDIQAAQEIRMLRELFLLLLCVSQMRDSAAVFNGEYSLLLILSTHQNCVTTVKFYKQLYIGDFCRLPRSVDPNDLYSLQREDSHEEQFIRGE